MKLPTRTLPPWVAKLQQPRENATGSDIASYAGSSDASRVDPSVPERDIGPVPSITANEQADRHGMAAIGSGRGKMDGRS